MNIRQMAATSSTRDRISGEGSRTPLMSFGIITDVQYADHPNGTNFTKTKIRHYRNSINILRNAVDHWNAQSIDKIKFVLQLGDIIDGLNNRTPGASDESLTKVIEVFHDLKCPVYHAVGNHELYNFKRSVLQQSVLNSSRRPDVISPERAKGNYYHFAPTVGFRIVVLDTYDVSLLGHETNSPEYIEAQSVFRQVNKNEEVNDSTGLPRELCMYTGYNGTASQRQLQWLEEVLANAENANEKVIIAGHIPICVGSSVMHCMCWNHDSIHSIIRRHHRCVLAYLAGHDHSGGYIRDDLGISYITFQGVVDTAPGDSCYATAHLYDDKVVVEGFGKVPSYILDIN